MSNNFRLGRKIIFLFFFIFVSWAVRAADSSYAIDTIGAESEVRITSTSGLVNMNEDSLEKADYPSFVLQKFPDRQAFAGYLLKHNILFSGVQHPKMQFMRPVRGNDTDTAHKTSLFYLLLGVCFLLAIIRFGFGKYFSDLFRAFFSPTLSQRQLKEQLYQMPFPAFALNVFFAISGGIYLYLILLHTDYLSSKEPTYLTILFIVLLMVVYATKYIVLRICGWLFGFRELMDNYIFTLFLINKILGVVLLPIIVILAFSLPFLSDIVLYISFIFIVLLFIYRYIRTFPMMKSSMAINKFHFFLYLCGLEIAPILIIGKLTLMWLSGA